MTVINSEENATEKAGARKNLAIEFTTKNFALTSALAGIVGYLLGTVFLYSYLSFFDWRLIWVIEQADVLKFSVMAIACYSTFTGFLWFVAEDVTLFHKERGSRVIVLFAFVAILMSISTGLRIFIEYRTFAEPQYAFWVLTHLALLSTFFTTLVLARSLSGIWKYSPSDAVADASMVLTTATILGLTFAVWVRDMDGFEQDVTVDGQTSYRVGVLLVTTHHTILYAKGSTTIVPSSSVSRIQSRTSEPRLRRM